MSVWATCHPCEIHTYYTCFLCFLVACMLAVSNMHKTRVFMFVFLVPVPFVFLMCLCTFFSLKLFYVIVANTDLLALPCVSTIYLHAPLLIPPFHSHFIPRFPLPLTTYKLGPSPSCMGWGLTLGTLPQVQYLSELHKYYISVKIDAGANYSVNMSSQFLLVPTNHGLLRQACEYAGGFRKSV